MNSSPLKPAVKRKPSTGLAILFIVVLTELIGFGLILPLLPMLASRYGASSWKIGFLFSSASLAQLLCAPIWGRLSDLYGRKPILAVTSVGSLASYLFLATTHSYGGILFSRILAGITAGNIAAAQAYAADVTENRDRSVGMGMIGAAFGLGFVLGPALCVLSTSRAAQSFAAALLKTAGFDPAAVMAAHPYLLPGLAASFFSLLALLLILGVLPEHSMRKPFPRSSWTGDLAHIFSKAGSGDTGLWLTWAWLLSFAQASLYGIFPLYLKHAFAWNEHAVAKGYVAMGLGSAFIQGGLLRAIAKHATDTKLLSIGIFSLAAGLMLMTLTPHPWVLGGGLALMTLGQSFSVPALSAFYSKKHSAEGMGEAMGWFQSASSFGRVVGPLWGGALYLLAPSTPFILTGAVLMAAGIATFALTLSSSKR